MTTKITPQTKETFERNVCEWMNWSGAPNYVEEIYRVSERTPTGWELKGYKWYYANRAGQHKASRKVYPTIEATIEAYQAWKATW